MKKKIIICISLLLIVLLVSLFFIINNKEKKETETDAIKFSKEYTQVSKDNVFVYKNSKEIISILEHGTGVVYLGFDECKWCQKYAVYLNKIAKDNGISKIYYFDILNDRENNTEDYKKIVSIIGNSLQYDEEGNKRVYVPDVSFIKEGVMIGHDYETSEDTLGFNDPKDYWTEDRVNKLNQKLSELMLQVNDSMCTECNKKND